MKIIARNLRKYYQTPAGVLKVLHNINLEACSGDFIAIMGPSGSGKSTLLFLLGCLDLPTYGGIILDDMDITQESEATREKIRLHKIGFVFQNFNLLPNLTVQENIILPMQLAGSFKGKQKSRALTLLRIVGLDDKAQEYPPNLSGGQQQKVALARSLANLPGLILADEPTGNLDAQSGKEIMEILKSVNEHQGIIIILVTHDAKIASHAKKIYYLDEGILSSTVI